MTAEIATKNLIQFMTEELRTASGGEGKDGSEFVSSGGISEQVSKFQFRDVHGPQMTSKGQTLDAPEKREALAKEKRKKAYISQVQDFGLGEANVAMNSALRNMMSKFKIMLD